MEFNSDRKRMSILILDPEDGFYKLYVKGADSIIIDRLDKAQIEQNMMKQIENFLTLASVKGFRTLLMAMRVLEENEVKDFLQKCENAEKDLVSREKNL